MRGGEPDLNNDCVSYAPFFLQKGGKIGLPSAPDGGNYYGKVYYPSGNYGEGQSEVQICPGSDDNFGMPIPKGYTPDWFAQWSFGFSAVFAQGNLDGKMYSALWLPRTDYFMYIYDENNNLIESYKIGRANVKSGYLTFPSPFQNGLSVTEGTDINLEIVHKTK